MNVEELTAQNAKNANIEKVDAFTKAMPAIFDPDGVLKDGDIIVLPEAMPQIYNQKFGENSFAQFIVVKIKRGDEEIGFNFFPLSLLRATWPAEMKDGQVVSIPGGPRFPMGTAVELFSTARNHGTKEKSDTQLGVEALLGKKLKVTLQQEVKVQRWRDGQRINELRDSKVWNYDLAD